MKPPRRHGPSVRHRSALRSLRFCSFSLVRQACCAISGKHVGRFDPSRPPQRLAPHIARRTWLPADRYAQRQRQSMGGGAEYAASARHVLEPGASETARAITAAPCLGSSTSNSLNNTYDCKAPAARQDPRLEISDLGTSTRRSSSHTQPHIIRRVLSCNANVMATVGGLNQVHHCRTQIVHLTFEVERRVGFDGVEPCITLTVRGPAIPTHLQDVRGKSHRVRLPKTDSAATCASVVTELDKFARHVCVHRFLDTSCQVALGIPKRQKQSREIFAFAAAFPSAARLGAAQRLQHVHCQRRRNTLAFRLRQQQKQNLCRVILGVSAIRIVQQIRVKGLQVRRTMQHPHVLASRCWFVASGSGLAAR